jgi:hypothetical protein
VLVEPNEPVAFVWRPEARAWVEARVRGLDGQIDLSEIGVTLQMAAIMRASSSPPGPGSSGRTIEPAPLSFDRSEASAQIAGLRRPAQPAPTARGPQPSGGLPPGGRAEGFSFRLRSINTGAGDGLVGGGVFVEMEVTEVTAGAWLGVRGMSLRRAAQ